MRLFPWALGLLGMGVSFAQGTKEDYERAAGLGKRSEGKVFRARVEPHWLEGGNAFWYRVETAPKVFEVVQVNAESGVRTVFTDPSRFPDELLDGRIRREEEPRCSRGGGSETSIRFRNEGPGKIRLFWLDLGGRPKAYGEVAPGAVHRQHTFAGHVWLVEDAKGHRLGVYEAIEGGGEVVVDGSEPPVKKRGAEPEAEEPGWKPFVREGNVWLRKGGTREEIQLSKDGSGADPYREPLHLSPDGNKLVAFQVRQAPERKVWLVESAPAKGLQPQLHSLNYAKPGDEIDQPRARLFDLSTRRSIPVSAELFPNPWSLGDLHWFADSESFAVLFNQRGHQLQRVVAVNAGTGEARVVVEETSPTFIDYSQKTELHWLDSTGELVWASERDGWNHLWLYDVRAGRVKNQVTRGEWVVREVVRIDPEQRQVWFKAMGIRPGEDPYHVHLARVNLDGSGLTVLTEGDGTHEWEFSPDGRWFIDRWSRVDAPPVTELRRSADGKLVCVLERADIGPLLGAGWRLPERFSALGRDGKTPIHGVIYRPTNFDPARNYPVLEKIYAGPHDFFVPKKWGLWLQAQGMAELGFIVVQIDGMGTNWRSRVFHDVCWKNLRDSGFPDRIAWLKAAAQRHPELDLTRVGIYGGSAGGQSALAALLFHGDFYRAAAADCGCHDNRVDKIWWNEAWMGWPIGPEYAANSNVVNAGRLTGKLLLTVGELDHNVDPASTLQVVDALVRADKDFELLVLPGHDHGAGETPYASRRRADFFVRHLLGVEPRRM
jgi:dipeptidyl aminopeptidase/acylaminoacyl peptidase